MVRVSAAPKTTTAGPTDGVDPDRAEPDPSRTARLRAATAGLTPALLRGRSRRARLVALLALVLVVATIVVVATRPPGPAALTVRDVENTVGQRLAEQAEAQAAAPADASVAHAAIAPSLVLIQTSAGPTPGAGRGTGAGVIVNADGTILTALHVVDGASSITVSYADGTTSVATIAKSQRQNDIATLEPKRLPETVVPAVLGGGVRVGSPVFAVGHPLGLTNSLSAGVVSALDRTVTVDGGLRLKRLIQFDAAVNPGNSGGPLLNRAGQVVGIVTGLANPSDQTLFVGIGFAVPISTAGGAAGSPPQ